MDQSSTDKPYTAEWNVHLRSVNVLRVFLTHERVMMHVGNTAHHSTIERSVDVNRRCVAGRQHVSFQGQEHGGGLYSNGGSLTPFARRGSDDAFYLCPDLELSGQIRIKQPRILRQNHTECPPRKTRANSDGCAGEVCGAHLRALCHTRHQSSFVCRACSAVRGVY